MLVNYDSVDSHDESYEECYDQNESDSLDNDIINICEECQSDCSCSCSNEFINDIIKPCNDLCNCDHPSKILFLYNNDNIEQFKIDLTCEHKRQAIKNKKENLFLNSCWKGYFDLAPPLGRPA